MRTLFLIASLLISFFYGAPAFSSCPHLFSVKTPSLRPDGNYLPGKFTVPNETNPAQLVRHIQNVPDGVFVSVGTERGFITAGLTDHTKGLILADTDSGIALYNAINVALLQASRSRDDYLNLRLTSSFADWQNRSSQFDLPPESRTALKDPLAFHFWERYVRNSEGMTELHTDPRNFDHIFPFKNANYLFYEAQFKRIHSLAVTRRIKVLQIDLGSEAQIQARLIPALESFQLPLSVLDISNTWWHRFMGPRAAESLFLQLDGYFHEHSRLIQTGQGWGFGLMSQNLMNTYSGRHPSIFIYQSIDIGKAKDSRDPSKYLRRQTRLHHGLDLLAGNIEMLAKHLWETLFGRTSR